MYIKDVSLIKTLFKVGGFLGLFPMKPSSNKWKFSVYTVVYNIINITCTLSLLKHNTTMSFLFFTSYVVLSFDTLCQLYYSITYKRMWVELFEHLMKIEHNIGSSQLFCINKLCWILTYIPFLGFYIISRLFDEYTHPIRSTDVFLGLSFYIEVLFLVLNGLRYLIFAIFFNEISKLLNRRYNYLNNSLKKLISANESMNQYSSENDIRRINYIYQLTLRIIKILNKYFELSFINAFGIVFIRSLHLFNIITTSDWTLSSCIVIFRGSISWVSTMNFTFMHEQ